ncbi:2-oxo acid dehydrogenase subunit E2 [Candidatus Sumerlaeota bacterium]|nr:2-oxo acid dehydrogenase subunit E2 [Candidatus Sumerlaeota bacterium]
MGESLTEGTITTWRKKLGEAIEEGETLLDISTAKVEVEFPSPVSGIIAEIFFAEGETVPIDTLIAKIAPPGSKIDSSAKIPAKAPKVISAPPHPAAEEITNGHLVEETDEEVARDREHLIRKRSTPLVRNIANDLGIDIANVEGTGIHGRVTKKDLEEHVAALKAEEDARVRADEPQAPPQNTHRRERNQHKEGARRFDTVVGPEAEPVIYPPEEIKVSYMRRMIAEQMVRSVNNIPLAYTAHEVDFTQLEKLRIRAKPLFETHLATKLTPLVFVVKAVSDALMAVPSINASWANDRIIQHRNVNMGIAVAVREGLVVPVLKGVEAMTLGGIARGLIDIATKARTNKLKPTDVDGATFTVTSTGQLGATFAIPIVNQPQGAILHFGAIRKVPVVVTGPDGEDTIAIRQRAFLTLGIDHRLIDGWEADKIMVKIKERIEKADFGLPV